MSKTRAALGATLCGGQQTFARRADNMPSQQFETAGYDGKQVVEVVGYPAGELPDRLHALCLLQRGFGALALGDFRGQTLVGNLQLMGAFLNQSFRAMGLTGAEHQEGAEQPGAEDAGSEHNPAFPPAMRREIERARLCLQDIPPRPEIEGRLEGLGCFCRR